MPVWMPLARHSSIARRTWAVVTPRFIESRIFWEPLSEPIQTRAQPSAASEAGRDGLIEAVGAGDAFKGDAQAAALHPGGELLKPAVMDGEDVVGDPQHFWLVLFQEKFD